MPERRAAIAAAIIAFVFHLVANPHYGFFRDELYFIICGFHPQWGYVDQPPVTPLLAAASQIFGHSLFSLRAVAALFGGASVYVCGLLAIEFGGGVFAVALAAICATLCPQLANFAMKLSTDTLGLWLWPLAALYVVRVLKGGDLRQWLWAGAAIGLALETKYSVLYFAIALVIALVLTSEYRILWSKWFAAGGAIAVTIALPNVIWQAVHGFPMWELVGNAQPANTPLSPSQYVLAEFLITNPFLALVWLCGLVRLLIDGRGRFLGYSFLILIAMMAASRAKHYYPANVYPILFSAGGVAIESWTARALFLRPVILSIALVAGILLLPYFEPILPERTFIAFNKAVVAKLGVGASVTEPEKQTWMTQTWADMHGWPQLAEAAERIYDALPAHDRSEAVAFAKNYGEASAIAFFSDVPVISGHNQYYLWGTRGYRGDVLVDVGGDCGEFSHLFREWRRVATFSATYGMPGEQNLPIVVCRGIKRPLSTIWATLKHYD